MKTVSVRAANVRKGDIYEGRRIIHKEKYVRRVRAKDCAKLDMYGVLIITPNPNGYKLDTFNFKGNDLLKVKRPVYNMKYKKKSKSIANIQSIQPTN